MILRAAIWLWCASCAAAVLSIYPVGNMLKLWDRKKELDPEVKMNVSEMIRFHGYPVQEYTVETEDGYLLGVQRIPHGRHVNCTKQFPVFLQHGLLDASPTWAMNLPNESLAYILADAGYDVWLGNVRGNTYSRRHKHYTPKQKKFWDWSWDEMAKFDIPAMLNFLLNVTNAQNLYYVGHSQGTTIAFAHFSESHNFDNKVKAFFALAPVATLKHMEGVLRLLSPFAVEIELFYKIFGRAEFLPNSEVTKWIAENVCVDKEADKLFCTSLMFLINGYDRQELNYTRVPVYTTHSPAGTSVKNMAHFAQMVGSTKFRKYDYGCIENLVHYGQCETPQYDVRKIRIPVATFVGTHDVLADPRDAAALIPKIPRKIANFTIDGYDHLDFVWGMNSPQKVYRKVIQLMETL